jgi:hypothetical protein
MLRDEPLRHPDEGLRLLSEEPGRHDLSLEVGSRRARKRGGIGMPREERRRNHVHTLIGRLGGEDRCDQQLEGIPIVKLGIRVGVLLRQDVNHLPRRLRRLHMERGSAADPARNQ